MTTQDDELRRTLHTAADTVHAPPPPLTTLPTSTARRRQAAELAAAQRSAGRRLIARQGRRPQLVAATIVAVVLVAGGGVLSNLLGRRAAVVTGSAAAAAVEGSFRATVRHIGEPTVPDVTFDVVDGRVHARTDSPQRVPAAWRGWNGFGETAPVLVDEQIIASDETYLHARAGDEAQARWYRYTGSHAEWQPRLDFEPPRAEELTVPVFHEGTRGFRRVEDADAAAQSLTRYSAQLPTADVDFLGWFAPMRGEGPHENGGRVMDIWVDGQGRVHRVREHSPDVSEYATVIQFDQFDALRAITPPSGEGDELPIATDVEVIQVVACGDPDFGDALRDQVQAELDRSDIVESYEIYDGSSPEAAHVDRHDTGDMLFVAVARLADDVTYGNEGGLSERLTRLYAHEPGSSPESLEVAYMCSTAEEPYIRLHS
jgi:hypothetical protein